MFKYPRLSACLLGILTGIVNAARVTEKQIPHTFSGSLQEFIFVVCVGFFVPLIGFTMRAVQNRPIVVPGPLFRYQVARCWDALEDYFDVFHYMFWGGISSSVLGLWLLRGQPMGGKHVILAFFAAGGVGFISGKTAYDIIRRKMAERDSGVAD